MTSHDSHVMSCDTSHLHPTLICLVIQCSVLMVSGFLCPPRARLSARNGLVNKVEFLGLIPQNGGRPMRL